MLSNLNIADNDFSSAIDSLPTTGKLKTLDISGNEVSVKILQSIAQMPDLSSVSFTRCNLGKDEYQSFFSNVPEFNKLTSISISGNQFDSSQLVVILEALENNLFGFKNVTHLDISRHSIFLNTYNQESWHLFLQILKCFPYLSHLSVQNNNIKLSQLEKLFKLFRKVPLRYLDLSENYIEYWDTFSERICTFCPLLKSLNISKTSIMNQNSFQTLNYLEILNLSKTTLKPREFTLPLINNSSFLKHLDVSYCNIQFEWEYFVKVIEENTSLLHLNLGGNKIGIVSGVAITRALSKNTTLKSLILRNVGLESVNLFDLSETFHKNTTLTMIDVRNNSFSDISIHSIMATIHTSGIEEFYVDNDKFSYKTSAMVFSYVAPKDSARNVQFKRR